jgi:hypothetical protein
MKIQVAIDIDIKELSDSMLNSLLDYLRETYGINEEDIKEDNLILLVDEIYKEMKKRMEE